MDYLAIVCGIKEMLTLVNLYNITTIKDLYKRLKFKSLKDLKYLVYNRLINLF